jgi:hypothetical protein
MVRRRSTWMIACGALVVALVALDLVLDGRDGSAEPGASPEDDYTLTLPAGGESVLPEHRLVVSYGAPQSPRLGILGIDTPADAARDLQRRAAWYRFSDRPVLPAMELIATLVTEAPGDDGAYRMRQSPATIRSYLRAARSIGALLILDIQPGRASVADEIAAYEPFLREPDVGIALDPEWAMGPNQLPGQVIGSMDAGTINAAAARLSRIVEENDLPEKVLILHQFTDGMIKRPRLIRSWPGVAIVANADGFGPIDLKRQTYRRVASRHPPARYHGVKLFREEDPVLMRPRAVMGLRPRPDLVMYE